MFATKLDDLISAHIFFNTPLFNQFFFSIDGFLCFFPSQSVGQSFTILNFYFCNADETLSEINIVHQTICPRRGINNGTSDNSVDRCSWRTSIIGANPPMDVGVRNRRTGSATKNARSSAGLTPRSHNDGMRNSLSTNRHGGVQYEGAAKTKDKQKLNRIQICKCFKQLTRVRVRGVFHKYRVVQDDTIFTSATVNRRI